jgi:hypothetical protein
MMHCCGATASSFVAKVQGEVFSQFHAITTEHQGICGIDCLAFLDQFFVNTPLNVREK